jgi:hypothetical protein
MTLTTRRLLLFVGVLLAAFFFEWGGVNIRHGLIIHHGIVRAQSTSIVPRTVWYLENGTVRGLRATRADGAIAKGQYLTRSDGQTYLMRDVYFLPQRHGVEVYADVQGKMSYYPPATSPFGLGLSRLDPATQCKQPFVGKLPEKKVLGDESMLGYKVVHLSYDGVDEWFAPDLGCEELKLTMDRTVMGKRIQAERHVTQIVLGEPDSEVFAIPAYKEMSPAELDLAFANKFNKGVVPSSMLRNQPKRMEKYAKFGPSNSTTTMTP